MINVLRSLIFLKVVLRLVFASSGAAKQVSDDVNQDCGCITWSGSADKVMCGGVMRVAQLWRRPSKARGREFQARTAGALRISIVLRGDLRRRTGDKDLAERVLEQISRWAQLLYPFMV